MTESNQCPRCVHVGLFTGEARSLHPRACGSCGGVWLAAEEAARVLQPLYVQKGLPGRPSPRRCPDCAAAMVEWRVGATEVDLDSCAAHGTWFDRDELEQLSVAAAELRGAPRPDFSRLRTRDRAPLAVAGAAAAIAASAVTSAALTGAMTSLPSPQGSAGDVALAALVNADVAIAAADVGVTALQAAGEGGVEAASGLLDVLIEFVAGLFS